MAKLVAYYSRADENYFGGQLRYIEVGNTEKAAKMIAEQTGADLFKIEQKTPYAKDYNTCIAQAKKDLQAAKMAAKKAAVKSVKSKKAGKAIVTVKKVAGAEGYQVQYSLKKSMKSAKNVKIKKNSITIKRLKKG